MEKERKPSDLALERDVLGSCLLRPETIGTIGLGDEDFALDANRLVWRVMCDLHETNEPVDLARIRAKLADRDELAQAGGEKHLESLAMVRPAKSLPLDRLRKFTRMRAMKAAAEAVAEAVGSADQDLASAALEAFDGVASDAASNAGPKTIRQLALEWQESLKLDPNANTVSPGVSALKRIIGRLDFGSVTLVGADTNVGKSSFAMEMLLGALLDGERVGYASVEDPARIVVERLIGSLGGISAKEVRRFRPETAPREQQVSVDKAMRVMHELDDRLLVSDCIGKNDREILDEMTAMARSGVRLVVLDYIGVVNCSGKQQDRRNEIRWIATRFKARAAKLGVALVIVSQFTRPKDGDSSKKPNKHSFRESGDLEAMAEYAVVMWRTVEDDFSPVYCELAKSKTGNVGRGWVMQRRVSAPAAGRFVEVQFENDRVFDVDGRTTLDLPIVDGDRTGQNRWKKTADK